MNTQEILMEFGRVASLASSLNVGVAATSALVAAVAALVHRANPQVPIDDLLNIARQNGAYTAEAGERWLAENPEPPGPQEPGT